MIDSMSVAASENNGGPRTISGRPSLNHGQILFLGFNTTVNPKLSVGAKDMFADVMGFYTQAQFDEFARTGDPSVLPEVSGYGPLLILLDGNEDHRLTQYQNN